MLNRESAMKRRWSAAALTLVLTVFLVLAGCGGGEEEAAPPEAVPPGETTAPPETAAGTEPAPATTEAGPQPVAGGVYRVGVENAFNFTGGFDPTGEYLVDGAQIYSNLLLRTLVGYKHVAGPAGNELIPDLAVDLPEVSPDGLTYTFRLKDGIMFGPPVNREITSSDFAYSFERIGTPDLIAQYGYYYDVIAGMAEFKEGKADTISGIETPDDKTIVFHLTEPTGDFLYRLAMGAAAPIPEEVAKCFTQAGEYGRFVIASGPYMLEGSDQLDITSCDTLEPISGYNPERFMNLVRNPSYDPATDTPEARENLPDRFELVINTNASDIFDRIKAGELEGEKASLLPEVVREYSRDEELQDRFHVNSADAVFYLSLNLTTPPFDDIHVRKAANLVMDKQGLQRANGGPTAGDIARHILPDAMLSDLLVDYDPYPSENFTGDVEAAKEEMRQSKYDTDKDGICDAPECSEVLHVTATLDANRRANPIIEDSLSKIGITLKTREFDNAFVLVQNVARNVPIHSVGGWGKDYPDASTYMVLFESGSIIPTGNVNYSLVGLTPEQAAGIDGIEGNFEGIPSVDDDIAACVPLTGDERVQCWADVDKKLMEEVVPWIPYLVFNERDVLGPAVTKYEFDQASGMTAYAHVAVDPSKQ
jgi:peptide/nickel transport system substrate-binding protein